MQRRKKRLRRRVIAGVLLTALLHLFLFFIAPLLKLPEAPQRPMEVTQISPEELARMKERMRTPLHEQELHEEYKSKEAPKDAKFMGKFNQKVEKETIAGAQPEAPRRGGSQSSSRQSLQQQKDQLKQKLKLSDLGLGKNLFKPLPPSQNGPQKNNQAFRPLGRDDPNMARGNDNLLNAVESEYYSFFARFEEPIVRNWYFNLRMNERVLHEEMVQKGIKAGAELPCTVQFTIDRSGTFLKIEVVESSGVRTLDEASRNAVVKLGSLPNPPSGIFEGKDFFSYRLRFMVQLSSSPMLNSNGLQWY